MAWIGGRSWGNTGKAPGLFLPRLGGSVWEGVDVESSWRCCSIRSSIPEASRGTDDEEGRSWLHGLSLPGFRSVPLALTSLATCLLALQQVKGGGRDHTADSRSCESGEKEVGGGPISGWG